MHHYDCVAPLVANSLQSGRFWARSTASVHDSPWESRSFCTVFVQVIRSRPGGLFQYTESKEVKICLAPILSSIQAICPKGIRRRAWKMSVFRGWLVWHRTSLLKMKWYHLMPRSIRRHHWWRALILRASSLVIAQHLTRKENRQYTADCYTWLKLSWPKTKLQNVGAGDPQSKILIDGVPVEGVEEFIYLNNNNNNNNTTPTYKAP